MTDVDALENKLSLLNDSIEFEDIVDDFLCSSGIDNTSPDEFRANAAVTIIKRFRDIYNLDVISSENGHSTLVISTDQTTKAKKYLHRFLTYKNETGGEGASSDGSAALFERISANAVRNYLGGDAKNILVGEGGSRLTEDVLKDITTKLNEAPGVFSNLPERAQDDGVDFITYKPFDGRNTGNIVVLGQACVGRNATNKKPIKKRWKNDYIKFAVHPPLTLLSVVEYMDTEKLKAVHSEFDGAIVFDRGRIMKYFDSSDTKLNTDISDWVETHINDND